MKTIEVSDEMYHELMELAKEMTTQDKRCTAMPHMFQIQTTEEVAAYDGQGETIWVNPDGEELRTDDDIKDFIINHLIDNQDSNERLYNIDEDKLETEAENIYNDMKACYEIDEFLETKEFREVQVTTQKKYQNTFFTAKACQEHINLNHYHYNDPVVYLNHAWRNSEMELVSKFLCSLVSEPIYK